MPDFEEGGCDQEKYQKTRVYSTQIRAFKM